MQIGELRIVAVALERRLRLPLDQDQHRPRLDLPQHRFAELAERDDSPAVRLHFLRRAARIGEVLLLVRDVEEIERIDHAHACPQMARAASTHSSSFARSSASVTGLPPMVLAKPHCGLMARRSASTYLAASSARRRRSSSFSSAVDFELTMPSTTPLSLGTWRSGAKPPARGVSNSSRKCSTLVRLKNFSATES